MANKHPFDAFAAFIYVTETEHEAVMRMYDWENCYLAGDKQLYYRAQVCINGTQQQIIAAQQSEMGMTASATLTMKLIQQWRPQYVCMPGIAAGLDDVDTGGAQIYGDVLLADATWNCSNGKYTSSEKADILFGSIGFVPRPTISLVDPAIIPYLEKAIHDPNNQCHVFKGYLASGTAVMANKEAITKYTSSYAECTEGLEMESYGVVYAANNAVSPRPIPIIAKSICDFGNARKDDRFQKFAAYTSCEFVKFLCENHLPDRNVHEITNR